MKHIGECLRLVALFSSVVFADPVLYFTEIHHCPSEPEPEWVEVYNATGVPQPIEEFRFCNRAKNWSVGKNKHDSIAAFETVIFTRDTLLLREYLGFKDVRLIQYAMGYLNNSTGSLAICKGDTVVDSVAWDKHTVVCPAGFNPRTGRAENTPGYQGYQGGRNRKLRKEGEAAPANEAPFTFKLSTRVVRVGKTPFRVYVESELPVTLRLLDSAGREQWKTTVSAYSNAWLNVPLDRVGIGVAYIALASGKYEKMVGILLRP